MVRPSVGTFLSGLIVSSKVSKLFETKVGIRNTKATQVQFCQNNVKSTVIKDSVDTSLTGAQYSTVGRVAVNSKVIQTIVHEK